MEKNNQASLQQSIKELDELIALAERVSNEIQKTEKQATIINTYLLFLFSTAVAFYYMNFKRYSINIGNLMIIIVTCGTAYFLIDAILSIRRRKIKVIAARELELLKQLFDQWFVHNNQFSIFKLELI
jgi:hypothetical protein